MNPLKILIPTDFSVQAEYAFLMVKKLGEKTPLDLHFLHVLPMPDTVYLDENGQVQTCGEIDLNYVKKQKQIAERKLSNLKLLYGNQYQTHFQMGKVTDMILSFTEQNHFDLIVMGTKGAWGRKEFFSGSETQMVARKSKIPVLSLMCDRSELQLKNILLVHDFSKPEREDIGIIHKLVAAFDSKIHFLQIITGKIHEAEEEVKQHMQEFAAVNDINNYDTHLLRDTDVENGVVHFNQMNDMDIICIGTHGKGGLFHQSATEKLVKHLFKPILSFHLHS